MTAPVDLKPGDQFVRPFKPYSGKARPVTYTVTGHAERRGINYVTVRSDVQGDGAVSYDTLGDVEVLVDWEAVGAAAFAAGEICAPAANAAVVEALAGREVGDPENVRIMRAFTTGWTRANLAAPVG